MIDIMHHNSYEFKRGVKFYDGNYKLLKLNGKIETK